MEVDIFCANVMALRERFPEDKKRLQQAFYREIASMQRSSRVRVAACRARAMEMGIMKRYRSRVDFLRMIGVFLLKRPVSPGVKKRTMSYLLMEEEIRILREFYRAEDPPTAIKTRARSMIRSLSLHIFSADIRAALLQCGVPFGFREKERMIDVLGNIWFGNEQIMPLYRSLPPPLLGATHHHQCPICLEDITEGVATAPDCPCHEAYHHDCLHRWVALSYSCPTCRKSLFP